MAQAAESVAIYWHFENLHANLVDQAHGQGAYLANRFRPQDEVIDVETIVEYALARADRDQPRVRQLGVLRSLQAAVASGRQRVL